VSTTPARLLVVDDERGIRDLLAQTFRLTGFGVRCAASGVAALNAVAAEAPDVIVLDVMLGDLDGFEVARVLRRNGCRAPVLFLGPGGAERRRIATLSGRDCER
jgi:two-component system, OmpR family, response regulator